MSQILNRLEPFFNPKSVLLIGVSRKEFTFNSTILKNLLEIFYRGNIYIVNPNAKEILGIKSYSSLEEIPEVPDLAVIVLGKHILEIFEKLAKFGVKNIAIEADISNHENFDETLSKLDALSKKYDVIYMGPSMIGILNFNNNFSTSIIPVRQYIMKINRRSKKGLGFIAQSGGLAGAMGWWSPSQNLPVSKVIHLGYSTSVSESDILEYFAKDDNIGVITLYLREIADDLIEIAKKVAPIKPILFFYVGKDKKREEELKNAGGIVVENYIELFEFAKLFLWCPEPKGPNLGIIGPSSGAIYIIVKEMRKQNLSLAKLKNEHKKIILDKVGGSTCNLGNPVDYWPPERFIGTKICEIYNTSSQTLLTDDSVDGLILALEFFVEIEFDFSIFKKIKEKFPNKPIITILIQAERDGARRVIKTASKLKIPVFDNEVERAVKGYKILYDYYSKIKKK
ncbi:MAG: CoA-binding protein [Promethearchaeota archaeon]